MFIARSVRWVPNLLHSRNHVSSGICVTGSDREREKHYIVPANTG